MRALKNAFLTAVVLVLLGTCVPVFAGQSGGSGNANVKLYWRYQAPRPRPSCVCSEPGNVPGRAPARRLSDLQLVLVMLESGWRSLPSFLIAR